MIEASDSYPTRPGSRYSEDHYQGKGQQDQSSPYEKLASSNEHILPTAITVGPRFVTTEDFYLPFTDSEVTRKITGSEKSS